MQFFRKGACEKENERTKYREWFQRDILTAFYIVSKQLIMLLSGNIVSSPKTPF